MSYGSEETKVKCPCITVTSYNRRLNVLIFFKAILCTSSVKSILLRESVWKDKNSLLSESISV